MLKTLSGWYDGGMWENEIKKKKMDAKRTSSETDKAKEIEAEKRRFTHGYTDASDTGGWEECNAKSSH